MGGMAAPTDWLLVSEEPWTRYRTLVDLEARPTDDHKVTEARTAMVAAEPVRDLVARAGTWPGPPLKRHNDAPTLLYALLAFGYDDDARVAAATAALSARVEANGWRCGAASSIRPFAGPGRRDHTCPMATTYVLKALAHTPLRDDAAVVGPGVGALLDHWTHQRDNKLKMFGIGTEFRKLRYPFVWYDVLHVCDVLSRYPSARSDPRLAEMVTAVTAQAGEDGRYTASAMYRSWKGWSFAGKR